jgi:hypothetical protein
MEVLNTSTYEMELFHKPKLLCSVTILSLPLCLGLQNDHLNLSFPFKTCMLSTDGSMPNELK